MRTKLVLSAASTTVSLLLAATWWWGLGPGATREIRGTVRDADGRPIGGARVLMQGRGDRKAVAWTGPDGAFLFEHAPLGLQVVAADELSRVLVESNGDAVVDLRVMGFLSLDGEVRGAVDEDGFVEVLLGGFFPWRRVPVRDGRFEVRGLDPWSYVLRVEGRSGRMGMEQVEMAESRHDVVVTLTEPGIVSGSVEVEAGLENVKVVLRSDPEVPCVEVCTEPDADGSFRLPVLLPGRHRLTVSARDGGRRLVRELFLDPGPTARSLEGLRLPVTRDAPVAFRIDAEATLRASCGTLHARHGSGLETEPQKLEILLDEQGRALFRSPHRRPGPDLAPIDLPTGEGWTAMVRYDGYEPVEVPLPSRGEREILVPLREDGTVRVSVEVPPGTGAYEVDVLPSAPSPELRGLLHGWRFDTFGDDGASASLPPGTYSFRLRSTGLVVQEQGPFLLRTGDPPLAVRFEETEGLSLSGDVRLADEPFPRGTLHLWRLEEGEWRPLPHKAHTLGSSSCIQVPPEWGCEFTFQGLAPGRYAISLGSDRSGLLAEVDLVEDMHIALTPRAL